MKRIWDLRLTVYAILACALVGCSSNVSLSLLPSKAPAAGDIPHFAVVDKETRIYRGGQPTAAGWKWLKEHGVRKVIKLNTEGEGSDSEAERLGMTVERYPITTWQQLFGSCSRQLQEGSAAVVPRTFVHCLHGQDRTGACVFGYRRLTGMPQQQAVNEMLALGFHKELHALWEYVESYP